MKLELMVVCTKVFAMQIEEDNLEAKFGNKHTCFSDFARYY